MMLRIGWSARAEGYQRSACPGRARPDSAYPRSERPSRRLSSHLGCVMLGPMEALKRQRGREPLVVLVTRQANGYTFRLHPLSAKRLLSTDPTIRVPTVSVAYDVRGDLDQLMESMFEELVPVVTGLSLDEVKEKGGITFEEAASGRRLFALLDP